MSKVKSLQYLLLDTLFKKTNIENKNEIKKISNSLTVEEDSLYYTVKWKNEISKNEVKVDKTDFVFYSRNDTPGKSQSENFLDKNNANAEKLVGKLIDSKNIVVKKISIKKKHIFHLFYFFIIFVFFSFATDSQIKFESSFLILILFFDLLKKQFSIIFHICIISATIFLPSYLYFYYSIFLFIFTIFEPDRFLKKTKISLLGLLIFYYFTILNYNFFNRLDFHLVVIIALVAISIMTSFTKYNSNYSWQYCFPAFALAHLSLGEILSSYIVVTICIISSYAVNYLDDSFFFKTKTS